MLQILSVEKNITCVGTDTNHDMLNEAKKKLKNTNAQLKLTSKGKPLSFEKNSFDNITICSVFFHLEKKEINQMLKEYLTLLKEDGKIIILTPTGNKNILKLTKHYFLIKNITIYIWYYATKNHASLWTNNNYLKLYANEKKLKYKSQIVMNGFAQLEIIKK